MTRAIEPVSKFFNSQGLKLHYLDWGNDSAPPLILVHGTRDHARSWDWVARELQKDWHIVALDLRGHGDSAWSPDAAYLTPYHLLDFADFVDALGYERIDIIAHSFGGNPTVRFAGLYPERVRKLVLVDAMGPTPTFVARWDEIGVVKRTRDWMDKARETAKAQPKRFATIEDAIARMAQANKHLSAEQARHLAIHGVRRYDDGFGWKYDPHMGNFGPEDFAIHLEAYWREITAETLICWGNESWTSNPADDGSAAYFRHHRCLTFEKAGHWLHHDQLDQFVAALREFL
ncbi:MAG TPA: alpha/beta hydrolase [Spongiibacteraceae bacterium]|nr:alpha/beta hydrolase [Spongiibacteraceae bacterium]